jgi:LmbE family N-acetylglucosaminyl deacetylase
MIRKTHTLMVVHAHPDDEASSTGGLLRFAAEQGHTTLVVTCTQGDLGEVKIPGVRLNPRRAPADRQRLALIRQEELAHAAALLGVTHVYRLGYHDAGMAGWVSNQERQAFVQAPLEDVTGRLVPLIRRHRPDVVVTYDAHGGYGHPDHKCLYKNIFMYYHRFGRDDILSPISIYRDGFKALSAPSGTQSPCDSYKM